MPTRTYLAEWMGLDLWELMLHIIRIHSPNLIASRSAKDLYDFDKLVDARLAREQRLSQHQLRHDAASRPDICNWSAVRHSE